MKDKKKANFFKKIFGQRSSCCALAIEEIDSSEEKFSGARDNKPSCCCGSTSNADVKKDEEGKE